MHGGHTCRFSLDVSCVLVVYIVATDDSEEQRTSFAKLEPLKTCDGQCGTSLFVSIIVLIFICA